MYSHMQNVPFSGCQEGEYKLKPFEANAGSHHQNMTAFLLTVFAIRPMVATLKRPRSTLPGGCRPPSGPHGSPVPNVGVFPPGQQFGKTISENSW